MATREGGRVAGSASGGVHHELVDLAFDAMFTRSFEGRVITSWNEGAERLYGWTRNEAIGRKAAELLCSEYPVPLDEIEDELKQTGRWEGEVMQCRKDGTPVAVACRWGLQTDAAGKPYAILEINSDLSQHHQAAESLLRSEERFQLFVSAVVDYAIFMLDTEGCVITWNGGAQRIKGYAADEIIGRHFSVFYTKEDRAKHKPERVLEKAATEGRYADEGWRVRKDGSRFWASVVVTALRDQEGNLRGFGKVTRDMTQRHNEEETLKAHARRIAELEQAKTRFLDLAAHELRGPLTLIRGYSSMLGDGALPFDRIPQFANVLEAKLEQIDLLVVQMLEMSRLEDNRLELRLEPVDLRQLVSDQIAKFRPIAHGHDIVLSQDSERTMVKADRSRVATIVANLVDNAIKYSPEGGPVHCTVGARDGYAFVSVRDEGLGIEPEHMPLLFRRFSRLPTEANKAIPGTGLALFLCQEIARRHGGEIEVTSRPAEGSEFTLLLPAYEPAAAPASGGR